MYKSCMLSPMKFFAKFNIQDKRYTKFAAYHYIMVSYYTMADYYTDPDYYIGPLRQ